MQKKTKRLTLIYLLLSTILFTNAYASDFLEMGFDKYEDSGSYFYRILMASNMDGATTGEITTPSGTYSFTVDGDEFYPEPSFLTDHMDLDFSELTAVISEAWILTWDKGLPTQTVATICFGTVEEIAFLPVPAITAPVNGIPIEIPRDPNPPTIEWTYGAILPCDAQPGGIEVVLTDQDGTRIDSDELTCVSTSWTPPDTLAIGSWHVEIINYISNFRLVPDCINITQGTWILENADWLALRSVDISENEVVATESRSWGSIKVLYVK